MKQIKPFFSLDEENPVHFCFQEAVLSAVIITLYIFFTDIINQYVDQHSLTRWKKYVLILIIMFFASFISIIIILLVFGYKCNEKKIRSN